MQKGWMSALLMGIVFLGAAGYAAILLSDETSQLGGDLVTNTSYNASDGGKAIVESSFTSEYNTSHDVNKGLTNITSKFGTLGSLLILSVIIGAFFGLWVLASRYMGRSA